MNLRFSDSVERISFFLSVMKPPTSAVTTSDSNAVSRNSALPDLILRCASDRSNAAWGMATPLALKPARTRSENSMSTLPLVLRGSSQFQTTSMSESRAPVGSASNIPARMGYFERSSFFASTSKREDFSSPSTRASSSPPYRSAASPVLPVASIMRCMSSAREILPSAAIARYSSAPSSMAMGPVLSLTLSAWSHGARGSAPFFASPATDRPLTVAPNGPADRDDICRLVPPE